MTILNSKRFIGGMIRILQVATVIIGVVAVCVALSLLRMATVQRNQVLLQGRQMAEGRQIGDPVAVPDGWYLVCVSTCVSTTSVLNHLESRQEPEPLLNLVVTDGGSKNSRLPGERIEPDDIASRFATSPSVEVATGTARTLLMREFEVDSGPTLLNVRRGVLMYKRYVSRPRDLSAAIYGPGRAPQTTAKARR